MAGRIAITAIAAVLLAGACTPPPAPGPSPSSTPTASPAPTPVASPSPAPSPVSPAGDCIQPSDPSSHVYHPDRLKVLNPCVTITGVIESTTNEADGDIHVRIKVDPGFEWAINQANVSYQHGYLIVEPVCEHTPTQTDAIPACAGYTNAMAIPPVGTHVSVKGAFVLDTDHGWQEIHPLTAIEVL